MNEADIVIVLVALVSAAVGFVRGFFREILSLISWIVAIWIAFTFAQDVSVYFQAYLDQEPLRIAAGFVALFVLTLLALTVLSYWLHKLMAASGIAGTDRILGALFGLVRAVALVAVLILLARLTVYPQENWWKESILIPEISPVAEFLSDLLPGDIAKRLQRV